MIQSGIAIVALAALLGFEVWSQIKTPQDKEQGRTHINRIVIALVDFHKAQCYFSSVIQITGLALFRESKGVGTSLADHYNDAFDTSILILLATSGLIPVNLILACITRYGRHSWYLLILSLITTMLSTATLIASYYYTRTYGEWNSNNLLDEWDIFNAYGGGLSCTLNGTIEKTVLPLCGNSKLVNNFLPTGIIANGWTWAVWANCIIWLFLCLGIKCYDLKMFANYTPREIRAIWYESFIHSTPYQRM